MSNISQSDIEYLLSPKAVRETTGKLYKEALAGKTNFKVNEELLGPCSEYVLEVIKGNYPELLIPFHSRWGHFKVGDIDREDGLTERLKGSDPLEIARTKLDLVITSVLLDAGAGKEWKFNEAGKDFSRSEGLAVASFHMFMEGKFSADGDIIADAKGLSSLTADDLIRGFQVNKGNPLVGVEGRVELINKLGKVVGDDKVHFPQGRPGSIVDYLINTHGKSFEVQDVLLAVLKALGPIWPGRIEAQGINLGDTWHYEAWGELGVDSVICFHKLSQWLTYSLVQPMEEAGLNIEGAHKLTGLAEYRNGGLFLDFGVIELRNKDLINQEHKPSSQLVIEWRALTVQLLDRIGALVQTKLGFTAEEFPLAKVLEGGTWWAGRKIASEKRDGTTPLKLDSDGTVF